MLSRFAPFCPPDLAPEQVTKVIGVVSDTHMPDRCDKLPETLFDVLTGVDLLLHAGDVGALMVLDQLSRIAPVIAVFGNDDTAESQRELPYQQLIMVADQRLLLTHSHSPNPDEERASRRLDAWPAKLARCAAMGHRANARVVVYGHTHVPMVKEHDGVLLVNPGAIASGSHATRQSHRTVALLFVPAQGDVRVTHVDLADPSRRYTPEIDWAAGFVVARDYFQANILADDLAAVMDQVRSLYERAPDGVGRAWRRAALRCWNGSQSVMTKAEVLREFEHETTLSAEMKAEFQRILA